MGISPGLGSALSGLFTAIGAVGAVLLAQWFFRARVTDLKTALAETSDTVKQFRLETQNELEALERKFEDLNEALSGVQETASKTQAAVRDQGDGEPATSDDGEQTTREILFEKWYEIAGHLEEIASAPSIDGRTRAKFGRIDRRSYYNLAEALSDYDLLDGKLDKVEEAISLWYSCRKRKRVDQKSAEKMSEFADEIGAIPVPQ